VEVSPSTSGPQSIENASHAVGIAIERHMKLEEHQQTWVELEKALDESKVLKDQLYGENLVIKEKAHRAPIFEEIVGFSEPLRRVLIQVAKVAPMPDYMHDRNGRERGGS